MTGLQERSRSKTESWSRAINVLQGLERVLGSFCQVEHGLRFRTVLVILSEDTTMCLLLIKPPNTNNTPPHTPPEFKFSSI